MTATNVETIGGERKIRLHGRRIHVLRCLKGRQVEEDGKVGYMRGNIFVPEESAKQTPFFEILAVSDKCRYFKPEHVGKKVILAKDVRGWCEVLPHGERIFHEKVYDSKNYPNMPLCVFD